MSETYLVSAKTVEEAIAIANREYADETHEVSYEILDMPKKGFLGIGARDAKIKITVSKIESADLGSIVNELRGMKSITNRGDESAPQKQNTQKKQPQQNQQKKDQPQAKNQQKQQNNKPADRQQQTKDQPQTKIQQKPAEKVEKIEKTVEKTDKPEAKFGDASAEYKTSLHNDVKTGKRKNQIPKNYTPANASDENQNEAITVSAPVGLTDFVSENKSFGSADDGISYTRMSNDIRKKKSPAQIGSQPTEKPAENPADKPTDNPTDKQEAKTNAPAQDGEKSSSGKKRRRRSNKNKSQKLPTPLTKEEIVEMLKKYDFAETDEDAARLDALLESESDEIPEDIREKLKLIEEKKATETKAASQPKPEKKREAVSEEEMVFALEFANTLLENMGLEAKAVRAEPEEGEEYVTKEGAEVYPKINIVGDDTGILIGHHGETLDSIQYLVNLSAIRRTKQKDGDYVKIVVDVENYREKREDTLRALARRMAARAVKYKRNVYLEPMNAYERRIIHSELQSFDGVSTHSVGADRDRKIIITYEGADKQLEHPRKKKHSSEKTTSQDKLSSDKREHRAKKIQKMPIEALPELLESRESHEDSDSADAEM